MDIEEKIQSYIILFILKVAEAHPKHQSIKFKNKRKEKIVEEYSLNTLSTILVSDIRYVDYTNKLPVFKV